jgi:hypothetical protein
MSSTPLSTDDLLRRIAGTGGGGGGWTLASLTSPLCVPTTGMCPW